MLYDLLKFPDKFKIDRELKKEMFLQSANLTKAEKRELNKCLKKVRLLYDLVFPDKSETIVLDAEIDKILNEYTMIDVAKHIAKSISYNTMIIVTHKGPTKTVLAKIYVFESRQNFKDYKRTRVLDVFESQSFIISKSRSLIQNTVDRLREIIGTCDSSSEFQEESIAIIDPRETVSPNTYVIDNLPHNNDVIPEEFFKERFKDLYESSDHYPQYLSQDMEPALEDERRYRKLFVISCADYCYNLCLRLNPDYINDDLVKANKYYWMSTYIRACNELARDHDLLWLSQIEIDHIVTRFDECYDYEKHGEKDRLLYIEELMEVLD